MGEIAEAMLDGTLCEACGGYIGSDAGYPQYCSSECAADRGVVHSHQTNAVNTYKQNRRKHQCNLCNRRFCNKAAMLQHQHDKHGDPYP